MRLPAAKIKEAILHADQDVRQAAVHYFSDSFSADPEIMPLAIQAIERYGSHDAFKFYSYLAHLAQTDAALDWLLRCIAKAEPPLDERAQGFLGACLAALAEAPVELLQPRLERIRALRLLDDETRRLHESTLELAARTPEEIWHEFDGVASACDETDADDLSDETVLRLERLADEMGRHREPLAQRVLAILNDPDDGYWRVGHAIRAAGAMRLEAAVTPIIDWLDESEDDDWYFRECENALVKIGAERTIDQLAALYPEAPFGFCTAVAYVLERLHSDASVQAASELFLQEIGVELKCRLLDAALLNMSADAIEPARQLVLTTPPDPDVLEVRANLLTVCKLLGTTFPEMSAWQEDRKNDQEFRRKWYLENRPVMSAPSDWDAASEFDIDSPGEDFGPTTEYEPPLPPRDTFVHVDARVGRNDPCPCGSGKKFKKCCLKKGSGV